ncbi:hypothetical protein E4665_13630 [Sporolactobacillus shoreae]|uniref:Uncharacterized protein n=1 Tax=Sporolactobacillus shoreae TaxID=1465501 RepID=A0A4Z0GM40_9BACL|nr:hypothetical protein [Sporolactobacillus shoreae]TGA96898.1 hypothetical protein E4665_13630 [Sporolactobacillus shoreae]
MKKWIPIVVITLLVLVLAGIKIYSTYPEAVTSLFHIDEGANSPSSVSNGTNKGTVTMSKHRDSSKESTFPFNTESDKQLAKKYPDKFSIVNKMYYSWDYIHNAQGSYRWGHSQEDMSQAKFYVDFDKNENRVTNEQYASGKIVETTNLLFDKNAAIIERPEQKIYAKDTPERKVWHSDEEFKNNYIGSYNQMVTSSEWFTLLSNNYPNWSYEEGTQFGMPVYKIKGTIPSNISEDLLGPFTMVVSKSTGALLDLKCYGQKDRVIFFVTCKSIEINKGLDPKVFHLNLTGSKQVSTKEFGQTSVNNVDGSKSGGVNTP